MHGEISNIKFINRRVYITYLYALYYECNIFYLSFVWSGAWIMANQTYIIEWIYSFGEDQRIPIPISIYGCSLIHWFLHSFAIAYEADNDNRAHWVRWTLHWYTVKEATNGIPHHKNHMYSWDRHELFTYALKL